MRIFSYLFCFQHLVVRFSVNGYSNFTKEVCVPSLMDLIILFRPSSASGGWNAISFTYNDGGTCLPKVQSISSSSEYKPVLRSFLSDHVGKYCKMVEERGWKNNSWWSPLWSWNSRVLLMFFILFSFSYDVAFHLVCLSHFSFPLNVLYHMYEFYFYFEIFTG